MVRNKFIHSARVNELAWVKRATVSTKIRHLRDSNLETQIPTNKLEITLSNAEVNQRLLY